MIFSQLKVNEYLRLVKTFQPLLATPRLNLISFDQKAYDDIFARSSKREIMQIFGHRNEEEYEYGENINAHGLIDEQS